MEVAEAYRPLFIVNTHQGLDHYKRVVYGITSGPALRKRAMVEVVQRIPATKCYIDDIVVTGKNDHYHCGVCKSKTMSVTNLELFVFLYCCRSAHSALHKRNTQPILMRFKITVPPQQLNSKIRQTQLHKRTRIEKRYKGKNLKFRDRTAKPKDHVTQATMKYIKIISIWRERHDIAVPQTG